MSLPILLATAALALAPAAAHAAPTKPAPASSAGAKEASAKPQVDPAQAFAMMNKMFDKLFPAGPDPDPARLAAARELTFKSFPKGAYAGAMSGFVDGMAERVLSMSEADFAEMLPAPAPRKGEKAKAPPSALPFRQALAAKDPNFDAKVAAGKAFAKAMFGKVGDVMEPRFREGMARSMARRFDAAQMAEIDAFLATPTGAAFGRQMLGMWFEPDVMRGTFQAFPEMMKLLPSAMEDAATFEQQMKAKPAAAK